LNKKIAGICISGIILSAFLVAADEILDIPFHVFNAPPSPVNWTEICIEVSFIFVVGAFVAFGLFKLDLRHKQVEERLEHLTLVLRVLSAMSTSSLLRRKIVAGCSKVAVITLLKPVVISRHGLPCLMNPESSWRMPNPGWVKASCLWLSV